MINLNPQRKKLRLQGYDYALSGGYFVTVCANQHGNAFGVVDGGEVVLNEIGKMVRDCWLETPNHYPNVILDEFIVMPDHFHGILFITEPNVGERHASPVKHSRVIDTHSHPGENEKKRATHASPLQDGKIEKPISLGVIIGSFKSAVTRKNNLMRKTPGKKLWQRGYHDRIIRNEAELNQIRHYVINNAIKQEQLEIFNQI
ncbi:MAG: transposase [Chloroflexota bacterium]